MKKLLSLIAIPALMGLLTPLQHAFAAGAGDLIKCSEFSAVYYLAEDGKRYVFPTEDIFFSWHPDFSEVREISCEDLASFPMGERIVYQAGTRLVKLPSDPSVFAVESDGVLREIPSEEVAQELFGENWSERVDDVSEAFWGSFTVGSPLEEGEVPEGTILEDADGTLFRVNAEGIAVTTEIVLDTDEEEVLEEHALPLEDLEDRLERVLDLLELHANDAALEALEELLQTLKPIHVETEDEVEIEEVDEIEDEDDQREDAEDEIEDAREEIAEAEEKIAEEEEKGNDVTESEQLLASAQELLLLAEEALSAGDYAGAENYAEEARHDAMWARGKAVDSIDDEDEDESDDADDDENEDESGEDSSEDEENTGSDDADDASEDESDDDSEREDEEDDQEDDESDREDEDGSEDSNDDDSEDDDIIVA